MIFFYSPLMKQKHKKSYNQNEEEEEKNYERNKKKTWSFDSFFTVAQDNCFKFIIIERMLWEHFL